MAMPVIKAEVEGLDTLLRLLELMKKSAQNSTLRRGVTKAVRPLARHAKFLTPVRFGLLRRSIGFKVSTGKEGVVGLVGARTGFKRIRKPGLLQRLTGRTKRPDALGKKIQATGVNPVRYAHLVEFGTEHSAPKPFLRPAWDAGKDQAIETIAKEIREALEKAAS